MPIESTILAYQGLQYDADSIADAAAPSMDNGSRVIIATTDDISAILQLRIALTQTAVLGQRLDEVTYALKTLPCAQHPTHTKQLAGVIAAVTALSDIASLATTVASITSVTESVTSQSGSFLDSSLINLVASDLEYREPKRYIVYLPSVVPSSVNGINAFPNLQATYLFRALRILNEKRRTLQTTALATIDIVKCKKDSRATEALKLVAPTVSAANSFEASLFGNGFALPATVSIPTPPPQKPPASNKPGPGNSKQSAISNTINISTGPSEKAPKATPPSGAGVLQRLLYVDLLLSALQASDPKAPLLQNVYLLSVHALESGGSQLTKTQLFLGTRSYFSGGAAATFTLINPDGTLGCSGITYGYRGFVQADDFSHAIDPSVDAIPDTNNRLPSTDSYTPQCKSPPSPHRSPPP
jgi:hypothetical protein